MPNILSEIFDWSEVWAPLIPLLVLLKHRRQPSYFKPVIIYLVLAFVVDLTIDAGWKFKSYVPVWLKDNNYLYNVHSIIRFICFVSFFEMLDQPFLQKFKKVVPYLSAAFLFVNFYWLEKFVVPNKFSSRLLSVEAGLLLFYCTRYFLYRQREERVSPIQPPDFWVVIGLSIYVVINFFIFLFYSTLIDKKMNDTAIALWNVHNVAYIVFCLFIAKAFATRSEEHT